MAFLAGGTLVLSYTNGSDRWELRVPLAEFDPATFRYTGAGLKAPTEVSVAETFLAFGAVWAPYFDTTWELSIEAVFWTNAGMGERLSDVPTPASLPGTSAEPSSTAPPIHRGFTFQLDQGGKHVVRLFGIATNSMGARRAVSATSGGFDARDQALMTYLAGPATGLVAWDGQVFPPTAFAYQRYKLRPFNLAGPTGPTGPAGPGLPPGTTGDVLVNLDGVWHVLAAGQQSQEFTIVINAAGQRVPAWQDCTCAAVEACCPPVGKIVPGGGGGDGGQLAIQQQVCGAAVAMASWLEQYYANVVALVGALSAVGTVLSVVLLYKQLLAAADAVEEGMTWSPRGTLTLAQFLFNVLRTSLTGATFGALSDAQKRKITCALYAVLPTDQGPLTITSDLISNWSANIYRAWGAPILNYQESLLALLLLVPGLQTWQTLALRGAQSPSTACALCGKGASMTGGVKLADVGNGSMTGGADLRVVLSCLTGGAWLDARTGTAMSGGATWVHPSGHALTGGVTL